MTATEIVGHVIQVAGPAVDIQFSEGEIPEITTAIRITGEGDDPNLVEEVVDGIVDAVAQAAAG